MATPKKSTSPKTKALRPAKEELPEDKARELASLGDASTVSVGDETLNETPERAAKLLRGIAQNRAVRARLRAHGYNAELHTQGWELVSAANGFTGDEAEWFDEDEGVAKAIADIDAADEALYRICGAALKHRFASQQQFLFNKLAPSKGADAVVGMKTFLARVAKLASGTATKNAANDRLASALLSQRGLTTERRKELAGWVKTAMSLSDDKGASEHEAAEAARAAARAKALVALRAWFEEWSEITRNVVTRRDHLIRLGLAEMKRAEKPAAPGE